MKDIADAAPTRELLMGGARHGSERIDTNWRRGRRYIAGSGYLVSRGRHINTCCNHLAGDPIFKPLTSIKVCEYSGNSARKIKNWVAPRPIFFEPQSII